MAGGQFWGERRFCGHSHLLSPIEVRKGRSYLPSHAGPIAQRHVSHAVFVLVDAYYSEPSSRLRDTHSMMNETMMRASGPTLITLHRRLCSRRSWRCRSCAVCRHRHAYAQGASAQAQGRRATAKHARRRTRHQARRKPRRPPRRQSKLPPRTPFTAADDAAATIPGMPDARFFADSEADFNKALPAQPGPWLILSTGGADGAFGAGLVTGLSAGGHRPDYAVVTGVSAGALMAPFMFAGPKYDATLQALYTQTSAADIFEVGCDRRKLSRHLAAARPDQETDHAGAARRYRRRLSRTAGGCSSSPPISMPSAPWCGTWAPSPCMPPITAKTTAGRRSISSAACCWPPAAFPAPSRRC